MYRAKVKKRLSLSRQTSELWSYWWCISKFTMFTDIATRCPDPDPRSSNGFSIDSTTFKGKFRAWNQNKTHYKRLKKSTKSAWLEAWHVLWQSLTYKLFKLSFRTSTPWRSWSPTGGSGLRGFVDVEGAEMCLEPVGQEERPSLANFRPKRTETYWDVETEIDAKYAKYGDMWWHVVTCQDIAQHAYNSCGSTFPVEDLGTSSADVTGSVLTDLIQSKCSRSLLHSSPFFHTFHLIFRFVSPKYHETAFPIFLEELGVKELSSSANELKPQLETRDAEMPDRNKRCIKMPRSRP